jgi:hypothetical protein
MGPPMIGATIVGSAVLFLLFERPFMKWRAGDGAGRSGAPRRLPV